MDQAGKVARARGGGRRLSRAQLGRDPLGVLSLFVQGVTTVPFTARWIGFEYWLSNLGRVMSWFAVAGLLMFLFDRAGRFLLLMLALSVVPYAFTWHIDGGGEWRFTMLVYPLYLIAARLAASRFLVKSLGYGPALLPGHSSSFQAPSREGR